MRKIPTYDKFINESSDPFTAAILKAGFTIVQTNPGPHGTLYVFKNPHGSQFELTLGRDGAVNYIDGRSDANPDQYLDRLSEIMPHAPPRTPAGWA